MRLIDADELKKHIRRCDDSATRATFDYVHEDDIDDMPTVCDIEQIRDEIEREADYQYANVNADVAKGMYMTIEIMDKHRRGQE